jgi:hypothetical protein
MLRLPIATREQLFNNNCIVRTSNHYHLEFPGVRWNLKIQELFLKYEN